MYSINQDVLKIYRDYTYDRASCYYKKEVLGEPTPWTDDPFLSKYKFTNIRRELDRQSKFLIETVINNPDLTYEEKVLNCFLFRTINLGSACQDLYQWPVKFSDPSGGASIRQFNEHEASQPSERLKQSNAYFLSHIRAAANRCVEKYSLWYSSQGIGLNPNTALVYFVDHHRNTILEASKLNPKDAIAKLQTIPSIGDFMSYQVWVDWTYMKDYPHRETEYVVSGPGCNEGIDWMVCDTTNPVAGYMKASYDSSYEDFIHWFTENLPKLMANASLEWNPKDFQHFLPESQQDWNVMNVENSFCELAKLMKLRRGVKMRVRYYHGS